MSDDRRRLLTYSNVVSTLALVIALGGGTAYAAARIGSADIIDNSIQSRDIRDSQVRGRDVLDGSIALSDLAPAVQAAIGAEGRAIATARVRFVSPEPGTFNPDLASPQTRNITAVRRSGGTPSYYCLTPVEGLTLTGRPALATPDWNVSPSDQMHVYVDSSNNECDAGELAVVAQTGENAGRSILPFYVVVF